MAIHYGLPMSSYRPAFEDALRVFARVSEAMKARGFLPPVLVGGAAVEIYSSSAINTGDFDIVTAAQSEFEEELQRHRFVRPSGPGMARAVGYIRTCSWGLKWCLPLCSTEWQNGSG
jgi:hypothetical protein